MYYSPAAHGGLLGGFTCLNVCNIHGDVLLASRYRAMLRPRTFSWFGTLPARLTPCQYSRIVLEEAPCHSTTLGKIQNIVGTIPKVPHLTLISHNWPHTQALWPKLAQKGTFSWIFDLDLWPWVTKPSRLRPFFMSDMEAIGQKGFILWKVKSLW